MSGFQKKKKEKKKRKKKLTSNKNDKSSGNEPMTIKKFTNFISMLGYRSSNFF